MSVFEAKNHPVFLALALTLLLSPRATAGDNMSDAMRFFNQWNFERATKCCNLELSANPRCADAHYLLGMIAMKLAHPDDAVREFSLAMHIDPRSRVGLLSRQALLGLKRDDSAGASPGTPTSTNAVPAPSKSTAPPAVPGAKETSGRSGAPKSAQPPASQTARTATAISEQMAKQHQELEDSCNAEVKRIQDEADSTVAHLLADLQTKQQDPGNSRLYSRSIQYSNYQLKQECDANIKRVRDDTEKKVAIVKAAYREKEAALEDSAQSMVSSYQSKNQAGSIILSPIGTNMHVRSYQTADEASGTDIPVAAPPAKQLRQAK